MYDYENFVAEFKHGAIHHAPYCSSPTEPCSGCGGRLECLEDYIGGGSHYWVLNCSKCRKLFIYDTYRFKLEEIQLSEWRGGGPVTELSSWMQDDGHYIGQPMPVGSYNLLFA